MGTLLARDGRIIRFGQKMTTDACFGECCAEIINQCPDCTRPSTYVGDCTPTTTDMYVAVSSWNTTSSPSCNGSCTGIAYFNNGCANYGWFGELANCQTASDGEQEMWCCCITDGGFAWWELRFEFSPTGCGTGTAIWRAPITADDCGTATRNCPPTDPNDWTLYSTTNLASDPVLDSVTWA